MGSKLLGIHGVTIAAKVQAINRAGCFEEREWGG